MREEEAAAQVGSTVLGWRLESLIDANSITATYLAHHETGRQAVLKMLAPTLAISPRIVAAFAQAERVADTLDPQMRPGLVHFENEPPFAILEYLAGERFPVRMKRHRVGAGPLLRAFEAVLAHLQLAHASGVVHGALDPASILLTDDAGPLILDFGIRVLEDALPPAGREARARARHAYRAPEPAITASSDIFAVGAILFEALSGRPLRLEGESLDAPLPSLGELTVRFPDEVVELIDHALMRDVRVRFPTADEMREALLETLEALGAHDAKTKRFRLTGMDLRATVMGLELADSEPMESTESAPDTSREPPRVMPSDRTPDAQGFLSSSPLVHLLVHMLGERLSGTLILTTGREEHVVVFDRGAPVKVLSPRSLPDLATLGDEASYAYFADTDLLPNMKSSPTEPLAILFAAVRRWPDEARIDALLTRLAGAPLTLHPMAVPHRFGLSDEEAAVVAALRVGQDPFAAAQASVVRRLLYALAITKNLDVAAEDPWPMGVERTAPVKPLVPVKITQAIIITEASDQRLSFPPPAVGQPPSAPPAASPSRPPPPPPDVERWRQALVSKGAIIVSQDHYSALGVDQKATLTEVQTAFFESSKQFHPDRLPASLADMKETARAIFAKLAEAHRTLIDGKRRAAYDKHLADQARAAGLSHSGHELQQAEAMLRRSRLDLAEAALLAVQGAPEKPEVLALLGWIRARKLPDNKLRDPLRLLDRAIELDGQQDRALYWRGVVRKRMGDEAKATADFRRALAINPKNAEAERELRLANMRAGR